MIIRYSRPEAVAIWSQETKYRIWFEIEAHAATKMAELGVIPQEAADAIWAKGKDATFDADRIDEIERTTKHDVIAFLTHVSEIVGDEARFLHQGMTSSDVLDTCFAVQLARSSDLLIDGVDCVLAALETRAKERLAIDIRHMQRTEVLEVEEPFDVGQKGSSAMPHKRNPILTENVTGLARLVRSAVVPAMENVALWHERDISHSSVERGIGPDATVHLDFALRRVAGLMERLVVYPENMMKNMDRLGGLVHSQRVMLALTLKGVSRVRAFASVQGAAM